MENVSQQRDVGRLTSEKTPRDAKSAKQIDDAYAILMSANQTLIRVAESKTPTQIIAMCQETHRKVMVARDKLQPNHEDKKTFKARMQYGLNSMTEVSSAYRLYVLFQV